jgi:hypothetical protein
MELGMHGILATGTSESAGSVPWWVGGLLVPLVVATLGVITSWLVARNQRLAAKESAQTAERVAVEARTSAEEMERLRMLEERLREHKANVYAKFLPDVVAVFTRDGTQKTKAQQAKETTAMLKAANTFWHESLVYSSDEAQRAFARFMQASFHSAPPVISLRLFGEMVIAVRREFWGEASELTTTDVWAPKINDLYSEEWLDGMTFAQADALPFDELCRLAQWTPPWAPGPS